MEELKEYRKEQEDYDKIQDSLDKLNYLRTNKNPPEGDLEGIQGILQERNKSHGNYKVQSALADNLREVIYSSENWYVLTSLQRDALLMIIHKITRLLSGDPNHLDSWQDIAGYATLAVNDLTINGLKDLKK